MSRIYCEVMKYLLHQTKRLVERKELRKTPVMAIKKNVLNQPRGCCFLMMRKNSVIRKDSRNCEKLEMEN